MVEISMLQIAALRPENVPFIKNTENVQKSWKTAWNQGKIAQIGLKIKESA